MKIALLVSGHFRTKKLEKLFQGWKNSFNQIDQIDLFLSSYYEDGKREGFQVENGIKSGIYNTHTFTVDEINDKIKNIFENKVVIDIEKTDEVIDKLKKIILPVYKKREKLYKEGKISEAEMHNRLIANYSMWYKWNKAFNLINNKNYDVYLRLRADWVFENKVNILDFKENEIITPPWPDPFFNPSQPGCRKVELFENELNDWWCYGSYNSIKNYCNLVENYKELCKNISYYDIINPHKLPVVNCTLQGTKIHKISNLMGLPISRIIGNEI